MNTRPISVSLETEFEFISDLCTALAERSELQPILDWLVHKTTQLLGTDECSIKLVGLGDVSPKTIISTRSGIEAGAPSWPRSLKDSVMGYLLVHQTELATPDLKSDDRFPALWKQDSPARALLAVPLKVEGRITGMLATSNREPGRTWSRNEIQLLSIIASHSAGVIEKMRMRLEEDERKKDLQLAHELQMRIVPRSPLKAGGWQLEGRLSPAREVGGDFYDHFELDSERAAFAIADVSGKGYPAALLVSAVQAALRAFAEAAPDPRRVMDQLNRTVLRLSAGGKFVTMFYGELDHVRGRLRYVNAGHVYPRLRHTDGSIAYLTTGGMPLGLFETTKYEVGEVTLAPGEALLLVSDGIGDAMDELNQDFGEDRMDAIWREHAVLGSARLLERLMGAVRQFRGSTPQTDDETALVITPK